MKKHLFLLYKRLHYRLRVVLLLFLWLLARPIFRILEKKSSYLAPSKTQLERVYVTSTKLSEENKGVDLALATRDWLSESLNILEIIEIDDIHEIPPLDQEGILVITSPWIWRHARDNKKFGAILKQALSLRRSGIKVWIFSSESCDIYLLFTQAILVSIAGGAIISQTNNYNQLRKLGVPHPYGPIIWSLTRRTSQAFHSGLPVSKRSKICILAGSGDPQRLSYIEKLKSKIEDLGYETITTNHKLILEDYINLIKSSQITVTTSWIREKKIRNNWIYKKIGPTNYFTGRILEGFAAGSVVITTRDDTLKALGFVPQVHYLELSGEDTSIQSLITAIKENKLDQIGKMGREHFLKLADLGPRSLNI